MNVGRGVSSGTFEASIRDSMQSCSTHVSKPVRGNVGMRGTHPDGLLGQQACPVDVKLPVDRAWGLSPCEDSWHGLLSSFYWPHPARNSTLIGGVDNL